MACLQATAIFVMTHASWAVGGASRLTAKTPLPGHQHKQTRGSDGAAVVGCAVSIQRMRGAAWSWTILIPCRGRQWRQQLMTTSQQTMTASTPSQRRCVTMLAQEPCSTPVPTVSVALPAYLSCLSTGPSRLLYVLADNVHGCCTRKTDILSVQNFTCCSTKIPR